MKSLNNYINEVLIKKNLVTSNQCVEISEKEMEDILKLGEYIIYVYKYIMKPDYDGQYAVQTTAVYVMNVGDKKISSEYGQPEYDEGILSGQTLDGSYNSRYKNHPVNNLLEKFAEITGIKECLDEKRNPYKGEECYSTAFQCTEWFKTNYKKYYDCR